MTKAEEFNSELVTIFNACSKRDFKALLERTQKDPQVVADFGHNNTLFVMFDDGSVQTTQMCEDGDILGGTMNAHTALMTIAKNLPKPSGH